MSLVFTMERADVKRKAAQATFHIVFVASGRVALTQRFINQVENNSRVIIRHKEIVIPLSPAILFICLYIGLNPTCNCREKTKEQNRKFSMFPNILDAIGARNRANNPNKNQVAHLDSRLKIPSIARYRMIFEHIKYKYFLFNTGNFIYFLDTILSISPYAAEKSCCVRAPHPNNPRVYTESPVHPTRKGCHPKKSEMMIVVHPVNPTRPILINMDISEGFTIRVLI